MQNGHDINHAADLISTIMGETAPTSQQGQQGMSEQDLLSMIAAKMQSSHQWYGSGKLASDRIQADSYYRGEPRGDEVDGRSQVVSRDVAEAIDSIMPSLMRIFAGGDKVVVFEPNGPEDEDAAAQATDYINNVFMEQNEGFMTLHTWFKDALLKKVGIVKIWHDVRIKRTKETYQGLTQEQFNTLSQDNSVQVADVKQYPDDNYRPQPPIDSETGQPALDPATGQPIPPPPPPMLFDCTVVCAKPEKKIMVANVAPDEFMIERRAVNDETAGFLAHRFKTTIGDLIEQGFEPEKVKSIPSGDDNDYTQERIQRFSDEDQLPFGSEGDKYDSITRKIWVTECYIKTDFDGDGFAEWRRVILGGDNGLSGSVLLSNEETDDHAFACITPKPEPHKFYGRSIFDETRDIQDVKTSLERAAQDSLYLALSPRKGIVEGQVNLDDLLDTRVGGIVRMKNTGALVDINTRDVSQNAMRAIEYWDTVREQRTGVTRYNQGLDSESLNKTATGIKIIANAGQQRLEMIARVFAETGVKRLFRRIFQLTCQFEDQKKVVRLRNKWVNINPRDWKDRMDVVVSVGVGMGDKQTQMQVGMQMLNIQNQIMQAGGSGILVKPKNVYNVLAKVVEAAGWKAPDPYFTNPDEQEQQPQQPPQPKPEELFKAKELELKNRELDIKEKEVDLTHQVKSTKLLDDIHARHTARNDQLMPEREQAVMQSHDNMQQTMMAMMERMNQNSQGLMMIAQIMQQSNAVLAQALTAPKRAIRDKSGKLVGTETVMPNTNGDM
jgi:hypothetical protein